MEAMISKQGAKISDEFTPIFELPGSRSLIPSAGPSGRDAARAGAGRGGRGPNTGGVGRPYGAVNLQQRFLFPEGGRGGSDGRGAPAGKAVTVTITPPSGPAINRGPNSLDDFYCGSVSPVVIKNHVITGGSGDDLDQPGYIESHDPETRRPGGSHEAWRHDLAASHSMMPR